MKKIVGCFNTDSNINEIFDFSTSNLLTDKCLAFSVVCQHFIHQNFKVILAGNIYNIAELNKLYSLKCQTAAELAVTLFELKGVSWIQVVDGDFTAIFVNDSELYIFRDRHGSGLQIYFTPNYFASEPTDILAFKGFKAEPNADALLTFAGIGYIPSPLTALKGVQKLPAGHCLHAKNGTISLQSIYTWDDFKKHTATCQLDANSATEAYAELLRNSIKKRVEGKSSVGLLLSGGYDSGGNIHVLREVYDGPAYTFSIGFKDNPWTELPLAKIMADVYKTEHYEYEIDGSEIAFMPEIVRHFGDPFQEGGLMVNYAAMKIANQHPTSIILGGDGNDQHFGTSAKECALHYMVKSKGMQWAQQILGNIGKSNIFESQDKLFRLRFHNEKVLHILESDCFGFPIHQAKKLLNFASSLKRYDYVADIPTKFNNFDEFYFVRNYKIDIEQVVNEVILFKASKMADLFQNDLTFPYMSTNIFDFLQTLPRELKCKGDIQAIAKAKGTTKFLHKNYLKTKLPQEITSRKKQGGFAPLPLFFADPKQRQLIVEVIRKSGFYKDFSNKSFIESFINEYEQTALDSTKWFWHRQVQAFRFYNLLVLALWWEIFINKHQGKLLSDFT
jgi:asparagine synthase (glutamine-hydrolysing)